MNEGLFLGGDIGGTKTVVALGYRVTRGAVTIVREETFESAAYSSFDEILEAFLEPEDRIGHACFGIAGPIIDQTCCTTNLPWQIKAESIRQVFDIPKVRLLNDLEAMALGVLHLPAEGFFEINPGAKSTIGNRAVIAAGTGLGEALLIWDGERHIPIATEGGHADLAAQNDEQDDLLKFLRMKYPEHVSIERILSGDGLGDLYDFLVETQREKPCPEVSKMKKPHRNPVISGHGIAKSDPACTRALALFVELYGSEAGNLALRTFATGGVYIGGGIAPKILEVLAQGRFLKAFLSKGRFEEFLKQIPISVVLNPKAPLIGALSYWAD